MDKKKIANLCLVGGIIILAVAVVVRLLNVAVLTHLYIPGLWKMSVGLLLISIAASVCKD